MGRKKMGMTYISNDTVRKAAFNSKKEELFRKLHELNVLCDVDTCALIYNEFNPNPEVWPSDGVRTILDKFEKLSEKEQRCWSVNHVEYLHQMIEKARKKNQKINDENKEKYMKELMFACLSGNMGDLSLNDADRNELYCFINQYIKDLVHRRDRTLNNQHLDVGQSSSMAVDRNTAPTSAIAETGSSSFLVPTTPRASELTNMLQSVISSYHGDVTHDNSVASIPSDASYYQNQNMGQEFVEEMIKIGEQTGFPWMEDNHLV